MPVPVQLNVEVPLFRGSQCDNLRDVLEGLSLSIKEEARQLDADRFLKVWKTIMDDKLLQEENQFKYRN